MFSTAKPKETSTVITASVPQGTSVIIQIMPSFTVQVPLFWQLAADGK